MLNIFIPDNFTNERIYIINIFFDWQLGIGYELKKHDLPVYRILLSNGRELVIEDHFFSKKDEKAGYLNENSIPAKADFFHQNKIADESIPIIFGHNSLSIYNENSLCLGSDIFASAFFMLTRWEEYISSSKDGHERFPASKSHAWKNNFLDRPVVNDYVELLWKLLISLGYQGTRKNKEFRIIPTHDIDKFQYWTMSNNKLLLRNLQGDIFLRRNLNLFGRRLNSFARTMSGVNDPCDTFDYLMDKAESINGKALFYFIAGGTTTYENNYSVFSPGVRQKVEYIIKRGHTIGIHPSYNGYNDTGLLNKEIFDLSIITGHQIKEGRNHYLRFKIPVTWQKLDESGITTDSTMYYTEKPGFRCGICNEFPVFDVLQRKRLDIIERPLVVMDTTFSNIEPEIIFSEITKLKETVRKYNGDFVFLWHNSNIDTPEWKSLKRIFEEAFYGK